VVISIGPFDVGYCGVCGVFAVAVLRCLNMYPPDAAVTPRGNAIPKTDW